MDIGNRKKDGLINRCRPQKDRRFSKPTTFPFPTQPNHFFPLSPSCPFPHFAQTLNQKISSIKIQNFFKLTAPSILTTIQETPPTIKNPSTPSLPTPAPRFPPFSPSRNLKSSDVGSETVSRSIYKFFEEASIQQLIMILKVLFGKQLHLINCKDKPQISQFFALLPSVFRSLPKRYALSYLDQDGDEISLKDQSDYEVLMGSGQKTAKVTIRENSEEFMEVTNEIQIEPVYAEEVKLVEEKMEKVAIEEEIVEQKVEECQISFDDSVIEEKLRKMMPEIVSKIRSEVAEEIKERSRISASSKVNNEPIITEDSIFSKPEPSKEPETEAVVHKHVNCDGCGQRGIIGIRYKCAVCSDFDFCSHCQATIQHEHPFLKIKTLKQTPLKIFTVINHEDDTSIEINGQQINVPPALDRMVEHGINFVEGFLRNQSEGGAHPLREMFRQRCGRTMGCPWRQRTEESKPETKTESKPEPKVEVKPEIPRERESMMEEVSQETILTNANYVAEIFGNFQKCMKWAQENPFMTKEELLNHCFTNPDFQA